jgi:hypothetical protein
MLTDDPIWSGSSGRLMWLENKVPEFLLWILNIEMNNNVPWKNRSKYDLFMNGQNKRRQIYHVASYCRNKERIMIDVSANNWRHKARLLSNSPLLQPAFTSGYSVTGNINIDLILRVWYEITFTQTEPWKQLTTPSFLQTFESKRRQY